jgi:hypothetical protein
VKQLGFIVGIIFSIVYSSSARNFAELESTYLGDGWFQYRFKTLVDPFFTSVDVGGLHLMSFTNRVEYGAAPANCTNGINAAINTADFYYDQTLPQERPYEKTFLVRSSERHFKRAREALFTMSLTIYEMYSGPYFSVNIVGYATMTNLVPCSAEEADGSPTNLISIIELIKDPKIDELIMIGNSARGVRYSCGSDSTVRLEASRDLINWTNVAYIYGSQGSTTWTTNKSLNGYGNIFRLALLANIHVTNLPPVGERTISLARNTTSVNTSVKVLTCLPRKDGLETTISTQPGLKYKVDLVGINGASLGTRFVTAVQTQEKVRFVLDNLPSPVFVQAQLAP